MYEAHIKISFPLSSFGQNENGVTDFNKNSKYEILPSPFVWGGAVVFWEDKCNKNRDIKRFSHMLWELIYK